jgi:hypothetical protein
MLMYKRGVSVGQAWQAGVCTKGNRFCPGLLQAHGIAAVQFVMRLDITSVKVWSRKRSERTGRRLVQAAKGGEIRRTHFY